MVSHRRTISQHRRKSDIDPHDRVDAIEAVIAGYEGLLRSLAQQPRTLNAEHRAILEAITAGSERAASNAMAAHLRSVGGAVKTLFPRPGS